MLESIWNFAINNSNTVAAVSAAMASIAAFFAVLLSIYSLWLQRRHNRLSVRPIANFGYVDFENEISIWLRNSGVGPMKIEAIQARCRDNNHVTTTLIEQMEHKRVKGNWTTFSGNLSGRTLREEGVLHLLKLEGNPNDQNFAEQLEHTRRALLSIQLEVTFSDIYGKTLPSETKNLSWFGRHFYKYDFKTQTLDLS